MAVVCHIHIGDEGPGPSRQRTFAETPRIGEFVAFSRDGQRNNEGVLEGETFIVLRVTHIAGNDHMDPMVSLDVAAVKGQKYETAD